MQNEITELGNQVRTLKRIICLACCFFMVFVVVGCSSVRPIEQVRLIGEKWDVSLLRLEQPASEITKLFGKPDSISLTDAQERWIYKVGDEEDFYKMRNQITFKRSAELEVCGWSLQNVKSREHMEFTLTNARRVKINMSLHDFLKIFNNPEVMYYAVFGGNTTGGSWLGLNLIYKMGDGNTNEFTFYVDRVTSEIRLNAVPSMSHFR
jgi:hypothetical protein